VRIAFIGICLLASGLAAYFAQPLARENADVLLIIITVMTVFAGFLVAIITLLGDPSLIPSGSWRKAEMRRDSLQGRITTHIWLFTFYLIAIGLLFVGALLNKAPDDAVAETIKIWVERFYLFFGISSFLFTFALPRMLWKIQMARVDAEIEKRRSEVGLSNQD
jgi:hypothetical protein